MDNISSPKKLFGRPITPFEKEQLESFRKDNLHTQKVRDFNFDELVNHNGQEVVAVDIGGNSVVAARYKVENGDVVMLGESNSFISENGRGYLEFLEELAQGIKDENPSVGISCAGQVVDGKPTFEPNARQLGFDIKEKYGGDLRNLFPKYIADNDAVTGLVAGAFEAKKANPAISNVLYVINGSGTGAAVLQGDRIFAIEPGHVEAKSPLKDLQDRPCGVFGEYVCIENIAGGKAGIETIWEKKAGHKLSSDEISRMLTNGDNLAQEIFDNSALAISYLVKGVCDSFELLKDKDDVVIVFHGGTFNFGPYCLRIEEILEKNLGFLPHIMYTKEMHHNSCMHGAAIEAVLL